MTNEERKEREFLNKCTQLFEEYKNRVFGFRSDKDIITYANEFYKGFKEIAAYYYPGEELPFKLRYLVQDIFFFDKFFPPRYIFPFESHDFSKVLEKPVSLMNDEKILNYLVDQTRNFLFDEVSFDREILSFETYDLQGKCVKAADFLTKCAASIGIESRRIILYPCFTRYSGVMDGNVHAFSLVKINNRMYLVDCTYSQFCTTMRCNLNQIGVPLFAGCAPGAYMQYDDTRKDLAISLLNRGWVEYTEENVTAYLDGFMLSYRNGLFYERTSDFSFTTPYSILDYENFIYGMDDLFNYENKSELGYQLKPLANPHFIIRHK